MRNNQDIFQLCFFVIGIGEKNGKPIFILLWLAVKIQSTLFYPDKLNIN